MDWRQIDRLDAELGATTDAVTHYRSPEDDTWRAVVLCYKAGNQRYHVAMSSAAGDGWDWLTSSPDVAEAAESYAETVRNAVGAR